MDQSKLKCELTHQNVESKMNSEKFCGKDEDDDVDKYETQVPDGGNWD